MLINDYQKGMVEGRNFNCAEKLVNLGNESLNLQLPPQAVKMAAGFGAGMGKQHLCGAVAGAVMILSVVKVKTIARESDIYVCCSEMLDEIENRLGSIICKELKASFYNKELKCKYIIDNVVEVLAESLEA